MEIYYEDEQLSGKEDTGQVKFDPEKEFEYLKTPEVADIMARILTNNGKAWVKIAEKRVIDGETTGEDRFVEGQVKGFVFGGLALVVEITDPYGRPGEEASKIERQVATKFVVEWQKEAAAQGLE